MFRKREIGIDLTSLLDVILIILFMLVINQSSQVANSIAKEEASGAPVPAPTATAISEEKIEQDLSDEITIKKEELEKLQKQYDSVKQDVAANEMWTQTCAKTNLAITYPDDNKADSFIFNISYDGQDGEKKEEYTVKKTTSDDGKVSLDENDKKSIVDAISKQTENFNEYQQIVLLVFTYNGDEIYREDYKAIVDVLNEIHSNNDKVLITLYDISKDNGEVIESSDQLPDSTAEPGQVDSSPEPTTEPKNESDKKDSNTDDTF